MTPDRKMPPIQKYDIITNNNENNVFFMDFKKLL